MRSNNVLGFIFAATLDDKIPELASSRTTASVPIGGKYRIIDFDLSNMSNSGISNVGIVAKSNFQSLMDHVGSGSAYDLSKRRSNLSILPPYDGKAFSSFVETIYNMHGYIEHCREEYVLISQGNVITNIDYTDVFDFHSKKKADITLIYKNHAIPQGYDRPITLDVDNDGKVNQIFVKPGVVDKEVFNHAYGSILIKKDLLMSEIRNAISVNQLDVKRLLQSSLGKYSIYAYENKGYCAAISSINDYFEFNMDLMKKEVRDELFNPQRPIYTKVRDDAPAKYGIDADVKNSLVADGCVIEGTVENCVLFRGVKIEKGAKVKNCILMQDTTVGAKAEMNFVITDKNVTISNYRSLAGTETYPVFVNKGATV